MKTNLPTLLLIPVLSLGMAACKEKKPDEQDMEKAREAFHDSPGQQKVKGQWNEMKGRLEQKFATLTDDDVLSMNAARKTSSMAGCSSASARHAPEWTRS